MIISLQLHTDKVLRLLQAVDRDHKAFLVEIENQANTQIVDAARAALPLPPPAQPDVAGRMASSSAPERGFTGRMASASAVQTSEG